MATMSGRGTRLLCSMFPELTSVSFVQRLNSIHDLEKINFGQSVPKHSLLLLHWFSSIIEIDGDNVIQLPFDPNNGDYGSHHYGNFDRVLDPPLLGQKDYTVGNINTDASEELPDYVVNPRAEYVGGNRDRIIFRVSQQNGGWQWIHRVFITQHYGISPYATEYDPEHTYEITPNLLRQIREFSVVTSQQELSMLRNRFGSNANESQLRHIRNTWGGLAGLGLLMFIVIQEKHSSSQHNNTPQRAGKKNTQPAFVVNIPENRQNHMGADAQQNTKLQVVAQRNTQPNYLGNLPENRHNHMEAVVQQNKLQVVAQRNTQPNYLGNLPEKRQNHANGDISDACAVAIVVLVVIVLSFFSYIIRKISIR